MSVVGYGHPFPVLGFEHEELEFVGFSSRESDGERIATFSAKGIPVALYVLRSLVNSTRRCLGLYHHDRFAVINKNGFRYARSIARLACCAERRSERWVVPVFCLEVLVAMRWLSQVPTLRFQEVAEQAFRAAF